MTTLGRVFASAVVAATFASLAPVQAQDKPPATKPAVAAPAKAPVFVIATIGDKHQVMTKDEAETKKKLLKDEHDAAVQAFEKEKKAAEAAHKKFDRPMPKATPIEIAASEFTSKEAALAAVKKMEDDARKAADAKKKPAAPAAKPPAGEKKKKHG